MALPKSDTEIESRVPQQTTEDILYGIGRAFAQGLTFGTADEVEAFVRSQFLSGGKSYAEEVANIREEQRKFSKAHPFVAFGAEVIGSIPSAMAGGAGLARLGITGAGRVAAIESALYGAGQAEGGVAERVKSAALSGVIGAGAGKALQKATPVVSSAASQLLRERIPLTVGQRLGGGFKSLEERLAGFQFIGEPIKRAEQTALDAFNRVAMNKAIAPLGKEVPANLTGQDAFAYADNLVSDAYGEVLPKLNVTTDPLETAAVKILEIDDIGLTAEAQEIFSKKAQALLFNRAEEGVLSGEALKKAESDLGAEAIRMITRGTSQEADAGRALYNLQAALRQEAASQNPVAGASLQKVNQAWKQLQPVQKAVVTAASGTGGRFTPSQLLRGMRGFEAGPRKKKYARGELPMQPFAQAAQDVMGRTIPESGTAGRMDIMSGVLDPFRLTGRIAGRMAAEAVYGSPVGSAMVTRGLLQAPVAAARQATPMLSATQAAPMAESLLGVGEARAEPMMQTPESWTEQRVDRLGRPVTVRFTEGGARSEVIAR
jgi:hypothetical protein